MGVYRDYFMESAAYGIYARVVDVLEIERVRFRLCKNNESVNTVQSTFPVLLCLLYTYWDIHHFPAFYFKSFQNPKMPKYAATHREMTKKTK